VNKPSIILADEPTGNLDTKTSEEIMKLFNDIHEEGNTVILVTHEEEVAAYAHRIIRLRDGMIETFQNSFFKSFSGLVFRADYIYSKLRIKKIYHY
jgi:ABC-type lipoprotein export system ATPase subunit